MMNRIRVCGLLTVAALMCLGSGLFAQGTPQTKSSNSAVEERLVGRAMAAIENAEGVSAQPAVAPKAKPQQALLIIMPETPFPLMLAADLVGLGMLILVFRRHLAPGESQGESAHTSDRP